MKAILIIDSDPAFLESLRTDENFAAGSLVTLALTVQEAAQTMSDSSKPLGAIFISASFGSHELFLVLESWLAHRYGTPLYLTYDSSECPVSPEEMKKLGIQGSCKKPIALDQLSILLDQSDASPKNANPLSGQSPENLTEEIHSDSDFHPTKAGIFMAGHRSDFDIYMRVGSGHYVKVIHEGDSLERQRLDKYIQLGVVDFYIKKDAQVKYLDYCSLMLSRLLPHQKIPFSIKSAHVFNYGEQAIALVKNFGINTESLAYCKSSLDKLQDLIRSIDKVDSPAIRTFFSNSVMFEHGVAVAVFAGLISRTSPFYIDRKADVVLLAALLHDIGLAGMAPEIQTEDESKMTPAQVQLYQTHPVLGAEMLSIRGIPEVVAQAVRQHHERRTGRGFPSQNLKGQPNMIAEVVGLGDEFLRLLRASAVQGKSTEIRAHLIPLAEILKGFSPTVVEAFQSVFLRPS